MGIITKRYVEATAFTHKGLLRANNEDSITVAGWVSDTEMTGAHRSRHELSEPLLFALAGGRRKEFHADCPHLGGEHLHVPSRWLLCSDGLTDMVDESELEQAIALSDEEALGAMFTQAMAAGGADNVSIILVSEMAEDAAP